MKKSLLFLLLIIVSSAMAAQENGMLSSKISKDSILIGDQFEWTLPLSVAEGDEFYFEEVEDPVTQGVETIKPFVVDTLSIKKGKVDLEWKMVLTSFDSGSYYLPNMIALVSHKDGTVDTVFFDGPSIEVNTIPIDTATFQPYDIKGQIKYPATFKEIATWALIAILVAGLVYIIVRYIKTRRENRTFFGKPVEKDPPHIVALRNLEKIRGQKLWQNDKQKQFYTAVTDTVRQYIADRYEIPAMEQTSNEMFEELNEKDVSPELLKPVKDLFATADFVKFAKYTASAEDNEDAIPTAVRFVNATFVQELEADRESAKEKEKED